MPLGNWQSDTNFTDESNKTQEPFTLDSELSEKDNQEAFKKAEEEIENTEEGNKELNLEKDLFTEEGQEFALVCFVAPQLSQKTKEMGMKIKGVYPTLEMAQEKAKKLMEQDNTFDIYVMQMYHWCVIPPNPDMMENVEYQDEKLNELIKDHKKQQVYAREVFNKRKDKLTQNIKDLDTKLLKEKEEMEKNNDEKLSPVEEVVNTEEEKVTEMVEELVNDTLEQVFDDSNNAAGELMRSMSEGECPKCDN